jgi:hypothetical protein
MASKVLRVRAVGYAMVQDLEAMDAGVRRFIGRKLTEVEPGVWGFVPTGAVVTVPYRAEYVADIKDGCLEAADEETAMVAGVPWEKE